MGATENGAAVTKSRGEARPRQVAPATAVAGAAEAGEPEVRTSQQPLLLRTRSVANTSGPARPVTSGARCLCARVLPVGEGSGPTLRS